MDYAEGIYVGYRYFDTKNVEPQFPFGFGLSYTTFEYSDLKVTPSATNSGSAKAGATVVTVNVKNTGTRDGAEVVELYVHDGHSKIDRPVRELKGFQRVELKAGEIKPVQFHAGPRRALLLEPDEEGVGRRAGDFRGAGGDFFAGYTAAGDAGVEAVRRAFCASV